jgi:hypothetical protein
MAVFHVNYRKPEMIKIETNRFQFSYADEEIIIHMKQDLADATMNVYCDSDHPVIDLSVWANRLSSIRKICTYVCIDYSHNIIGFENYPNLRSLNIRHRFNDKTYYDKAYRNLVSKYYTQSLNGIEYCENLESLTIDTNNISDLTPISKLSLIYLSIVCNPISSLAPVNFKTLKQLKIDVRQLDLIDDGCDLSTLECITVVKSFPETLEHPKVIEIMQKYPHLKCKYLIDGYVVKISASQ